jgi:hypothetical protein
MLYEYALTFTILTIFTMGLHFWSDMRELKVDSRRNYMMVGAVLAIGLISGEVFVLITSGFLVIAFLLLLGYLEKKQGRVVFGDGDKEILGWSVPGIAICFGWFYASLFMGFIVASFFILAFLRYKLFINEQKLPGLIILSFSYIILLIIVWFL